jgi:hypothetical protein
VEVASAVSVTSRCDGGGEVIVMVGESEEEKLSLGGKCEQRPWLVLKMPVGRQPKHETCVRGMAMVLYPDPVLVLALQLRIGRRRLRPLPLSPRVAGPESRHRRSSLFLFWLFG